MIRPLTRAEFQQLAARDPYYQKRWDYQSRAIAAGWDILGRRGQPPESARVLELGPHKHPLFVGSDVMDLRINPELRSVDQVICHNARMAPWPVGDKSYDLFVGLQVFEHLTGAQEIAFREVRRIARSAVISLPIEWRPRSLPDYLNCHTLISHQTAMRWFGFLEPSTILQGNGWPYSRMIYVFEDNL